MTKTFHSNGKLLISGEYVVLDGATSLALPTSLGQSLEVQPNNTTSISWNSYTDQQELWLQTEFLIEDVISGKKTFIENPHQTLYNILNVANQLNPTILKRDKGFMVNTYLEFPNNWGLGSSSTLINNIAQWFSIDAFELLWKSFSGSGYDIACAQHHTAITYTLMDKTPVIHAVPFNPEFKDQLYFVHLNQKQNSREGIALYREQQQNKAKAIQQISSITAQLLKCTTLTQFNKLINQHEEIISQLIQLPTVKSRLFSDFNSSIKSLGAWGGDFVLATGEASEMDYFRNRGYTTILSYSELIKSI